MALLEAEDARNLELKLDLEQAFERYMQAGDGERAQARAIYLTKLRAFSARVLGRAREVASVGEREGIA